MNNINKFCYITDKESWYYGEWGVIKYFDGEYYHIAIRNGTDSLPIFARNEIRIPRAQPKKGVFKNDKTR